MLTLDRLPSAQQWKEDIDKYDDATVFQTAAWLSFVSAVHGAEPVVATLKEGGEVVGYFTGLIVDKWGLRVLGSPLPGWTTSYMGLCLKTGVNRPAALHALVKFAFDKLKCVHVEMMDRRAAYSDLGGFKASYRLYSGYQVDLRPSERDIFQRMSKKSCQYCIRKAEKNGVVIEEASDMGFAEDYYKQLKDVFAKQGLVPTYGVERVCKLINHLHPTGMLLLLRARDTQGRCIATGIYPAMNRTMYFWGGASWRPYQHLYPNEALHWYAMKYWKRRGIEFYDMGGGGRYKKKYGGEEIVVPWFRMSKYPWITPLRHLVKEMFFWRQRIRGAANRFGRYDKVKETIPVSSSC